MKKCYVNERGRCLLFDEPCDIKPQSNCDYYHRNAEEGVEKDITWSDTRLSQAFNRYSGFEYAETNKTQREA